MSGLVIPNIELIESTDNFGVFIAEPLEKGVGITLGNSLRRVLLGYLPGAAVTQVKMDGIQHEFSVIPNVREDAMEFMLNVKSLRIKPVSEQAGQLILDVQGEGRVCAADIKPSADFEIANPELCLATLNSPEAKLYAEFNVELGTGFKTAESSDNMPVGTIPVDAIFTPIRKINFTIEPIHLGQEVSRERLRLEVWTDGTTSPVDAVSRGAAILIEQLTPFFEYARISQMKAEERLVRLSIPDEKYNMPVDQLDLSVRTMNCLRRSGIATVGELVAKGPKDLMKLRNFGQKSAQEIEDRINSMGLSIYPQNDTGEEEKETSQEEAEELPEESKTGGETEETAESEAQSGESPS